MKPPFFIETLARNGEVLNRRQVNSLPIRLGRGYDNDIILDDAHSAARHAIVEAFSDEQLILHDLGSQNGTIHNGRRHSSVILGGDTVVRLGHTNLRVRGADFPVPRELPDTTMHGWEGALPALAGLILIATVAALATWLSDADTFQPITYLLAIASSLGAGLVWGGVWAAGNRLFGGHARLGRHLFILGCGLSAMGLWKVGSSMLAWAWSLELLTRYGSHMLVAIGCAMVLFHLRTIKARHPRHFAPTVLVLLVLGSSLILMSNLQRTGHLSDELYMSLIMPPAMRQSRDHTVDEFMLRASALKPAVDAGRVKNANGAEDDDEE